MNNTGLHAVTRRTYKASKIDITERKYIVDNCMSVQESLFLFSYLLVNNKYFWKVFSFMLFLIEHIRSKTTLKNRRSLCTIYRIINSMHASIHWEGRQACQYKLHPDGLSDSCCTLHTRCLLALRAAAIKFDTWEQVHEYYAI